MVSIRALRETDDCSRFSSGHDQLDRFLRKYAAKNQYVLHIGATYVAEEGDRIVGFVTVAPGSIKADEFASLKGFPRYPLPVLRLARLAVDRSMQGKGLGTTLLRYVFMRALEMGENLGCVGVVVDSKPESVGYYAKFGFKITPSHAGQVQDVPEPVPMFLDIATIRCACEE